MDNYINNKASLMFNQFTEGKQFRIELDLFNTDVIIHNSFNKIEKRN